MRNICEEKMVDFRLFAAGLGEAGLRSDGTSLGETLFRARLRLVCGHSAAKRKGLRAVGNSDHSGVDSQQTGRMEEVRVGPTVVAPGSSILMRGHLKAMRASEDTWL